MRAVVLVSWVVGAGLLVAGRAQATPRSAPRTSSLAWVRSEGADACIGGKELAEAVERTLGRRVFVSASAADVAVEGRIDKAAGGPGWKATIRISDDQGSLLGRRELASPAADCRAMDDSLAFVIAVMIDPDAVSHPPVPIAQPTPPVPAPVPPPAPPAPEPAPVPKTSSPWQIAPQLGVVAAFGEQPAPALGALLRVRLGPPAIGVELVGSLFAPQDAAVPGASSAAVHFTWAYAGALLCPTLARLGSVSLGGCAGALGGVLTATPKGLSDEQGTANFGVLAALRARADWHLTSRIFLAAEAGIDVPFGRPQWNATTASGQPETIFRFSAVAGEADLAVGVALE